jgi:hypothetical protein
MAHFANRVGTFALGLPRLLEPLTLAWVEQRPVMALLQKSCG